MSLRLVILLVRFCSGLLPAQSPPAIEASPTPAAKIREIATEDARQSLSVLIRGVVMSDPVGQLRSTFHVADASGCIFLEGESTICRSLKRGQLVEIQGHTIPGLFGSYARINAVKVIGEGPIPPPIPVTYEELNTGRHIQQWVKISGVIRRIDPLGADSPDAWRIEFVSGGGRVTVLLRRPASEPPPIDTTIEVSAMCSGRFNRQQQWLGATLLMPANTTLSVLEPALPVPPLRAIDELMAFHADNSNLHRVRVRGVVSYAAPGESIWIQDGALGLRLNTKGTETFSTGDFIEASGFAAFGSYSPILEDVSITRLSQQAPPTPLHLQDAASAVKADAQLISIEGLVVNQNPIENGIILTLSSETWEFPVQLNWIDASTALKRWPIGSKIRATGICSASGVVRSLPTSERNLVSVISKRQENPTLDLLDTGPIEPRHFTLLARDPSDLQVLEFPSRWTVDRFSWLLGIISLALFLGITFLSLSTKRRLKQAAEARQKSEAEFAAMMKERSRIAREIHDTLAQGLSAISLHLELVRDHVAPASLGAQSLDEARSLVRSSMKEARNSIWKMRSHALETGNLATALQDVLNHLRGVESQLTVSGDLRRMPPIVENNLLRIGQEAITNAKKYSGATKIDVRIEVEKDKLHLHVCDNGRGFNVESTGNTDSQFGLVGLRERAKEINATLSIATSPGQGTDIAVTLRDPTADPSSLKEALS